MDYYSASFEVKVERVAADYAIGKNISLISDLQNEVRGRMLHLLG